ncbi:MAG: class I SAM-dependent methyltransferase [Beijerinckiaceae bacterium]
MLNTIKRSRPVYAAGRKLRFAIGSRLGAREIPGIGSRAHFNDFMLTSANPKLVAEYVAGARQFVGILERSLNEAGKDWRDVDACLEVGCGYGRIIRELRHKLHPSKIYAADVIDEGARFAASEFGVNNIPVLENTGDKYDGKFDLIYLLSVYTHLRRDMIETNLKQVAKALKPGGVVVFSTHGQGSADTAERYDQYWLDKDKMLRSLARDGYFYERYPYYYDEYGLTWMTSTATKNLVAHVTPELEFVVHTPMDVDDHQDTFVYRKR